MKKLPVITIALMVLVFAALGALYAKKEYLAQKGFEGYLQTVLGCRVEIRNVNVSRRMNKIKIQKMTIKNPSGYELENLAVVRNVRMKVDPGKFWIGRKVRIIKLEADIAEINVERDEKGELNLRELPALSNEILNQTIKSEARMKPVYLIDRLEFRYGKVVFREWVKDAEPRISETDVGKQIDVYGYVTDPYLLVYAPLMTTLRVLNRGSLGVPRGGVQRRILATIGKPKVAVPAQEETPPVSVDSLPA